MAGIYIHIPFCKQKCSYCDFHFSTSFGSYRDRMIEAICSELKNRKNYLDEREVETIYFGGGTPSLLSKEELSTILWVISENYPVHSGAEITLEANPDDINTSILNDWKELGVNRLSIGLQSFRKDDLEWMNRAHTVEESLNCVQLAQKSGFENLTVDLIYGLPGLSMKEWKSHVQTVIDFGVPHVSAYCLTVEEKTALENWVRKGKIVPASDDQQSEQFQLLIEMLEANGIVQYEISNFAKEGFESRHNSNYWKGEWYLGIGPSAHSFNGTSRYWNVSNNHGYMKAIFEGEESGQMEELSKNDQFNEYILTGLRTIYGVRIDKLREILALDESFDQDIMHFIQNGWMIKENEIIRLTKEGKLKADYIASELFRVD